MGWDANLMSATAAPAIKPASAAPPRAADARTAPSNDHEFDRRLDAARQQHRQEGATASDDSTAKPDHASPPGDAKDAAAPAKAAVATKDTADAASDAAALAAAMLALLGQSAPAAAPVAPVPGALAAADSPRNALAALTATGKPKVADTALGALLGAGAGAAAVATATATPAPATSAFAGSAIELLPGIVAPKDDRATALPDIAAQAAALNAAASNPLASTPATHLLSVTSTVGTPAFAQDLGRQITWLGSQDLKEARIKLHPEDLGALDVKVSVNHDRVDLTFIAQHPATVHAVQQSLAHLDAMLAQQGMTLGHADVSQQQRGDGSGKGAGSNPGFGEADEAAVAALSPVSSLAPTLLDTFA
jgi:flagellar hook-length control protein FliK